MAPTDPPDADRRALLVSLASIALAGCASRDQEGGPEPVPVDRSRLFPMIVPPSYLPDRRTFRTPLLPGLVVTLIVHDGAGAPRPPVPDGEGVMMFLRTLDVSVRGLGAATAHRIAVDNLATAAEHGEIHSVVATGTDGKPKMAVWDDHWLAATCLLLPGLHANMARALGTQDLAASIPHREAMLVFPAGDAATRQEMTTLIARNEGDGRKPITDRLLRLLPGTTRPWYDQTPVAWL